MFWYSYFRRNVGREVRHEVFFVELAHSDAKHFDRNQMLHLQHVVDYTTCKRHIGSKGYASYVGRNPNNALLFEGQTEREIRDPLRETLPLLSGN